MYILCTRLTIEKAEKLSNHGIILPKKKWHNCLQKVQCFYPTHHISPERKLHKPHNSTCWKIRIYIPDTFTQLNPFVGPVALYVSSPWLAAAPPALAPAWDFSWLSRMPLSMNSDRSFTEGKSNIMVDGKATPVRRNPAIRGLSKNGLRQGWYLQDNDKLQIVHYWEFGPSIGSHYRPALRYLNSSRTLEGMLVVYTVYYVCGIYGLHIYDARIKGPFERPEYFSPKGEKPYLQIWKWVNPSKWWSYQTGSGYRTKVEATLSCQVVDFRTFTKPHLWSSRGWIKTYSNLLKGPVEHL